ncbi:MAG: hypothetical protein H0W72_10255, partial [Planctomycetes bacterium]|nr:hypothetical protein [Planctomycetota bacterium]
MDVHGFLQALRARLRRVLVLDGVAKLMVTGLVAAATIAVLDWCFVLPGLVRLGALAALATGLFVLALRRLHRPLSRGMDDRTLAALAERRIPALDGRLLSGVDGIRLSAVDVGELAGLLDERAPRTLVPAIALPRRLAIAAGLLAAAGAVALLQPDIFSAALQRLFLPLGDTEWMRTSTLTARLERPVVPADEPLVLDVSRPRGDEATVRVAWTDRRSSGPGEFRTLDGLVGSIARRQALSLPPGDYRITVTSGDARELVLDGRVVARPTLGRIAATLTPPAYTGEPPQALSTLACSALPGSRLDFALDFSMDADRRIERITLALAGTELPIERMPQGLRGSFEVRSGGEIVVSVVDQDGIGAKPEPRFTVALLEDRAPDVHLGGPRNNESVSLRAVVGLSVEAHDDRGLASLELASRTVPATQADAAGATPAVAAAPGEEAVLVRFPDVSGQATTRPWDLEVAKVAKIGERIQLVGRAADRNDVTGPGIGVSEVLVLRVVTDEELRQDIERVLADALERIGQSRSDLARGLARKDQLDAASRNALQNARKATEALVNSLRRERENRFPDDQVAPVAKAASLMADKGLPALGQVPSAGDQAEALAREGDQALAESERLLNSILQEGDLSRQLANLLGRERLLAEESRAFVREHLTKPVDETAKARQTNLADRQRELSEQMRELERRVLSGSEQLKEAQELVRELQPAEQLGEASRQLGSADQRAKAPARQESAIQAMQKLLEKLRGGDANKALAERAGALAADQEQINKELELGADPRSLRDREARLAEETEALRRQVEEQAKDENATKLLGDAKQSADAAGKAMGSGDSAGAGREGSSAAAQLREAQKSLQGDEEQPPEDKDKPKAGADVLKLLRELRTLQVAIVSDAQTVHRRIGDKALDFAAKREVARIAEQQEEVLLRLNEEGIKELEKHPIALRALQRVAVVMQRASDRLEEPALGDKGVRLVKTALHELNRLIEIAENLPDPESDGSQGKGDGGQGGQQAPFPPAAEIALMIAMQQELAMRTATGQPGDLAGAQKELLGLIQLLAGGTRPGSRPAVLLERADRAMASASYLLGQKDTGLTTRHEQEVASLALQRLLAEAKASSGGGGGGEGGKQQEQKRGGAGDGTPQE